MSSLAGHQGSQQTVNKLYSPCFPKVFVVNKRVKKVLVTKTSIGLNAVSIPRDTVKNARLVANRQLYQLAATNLLISSSCNNRSVATCYL